MTAGLILLAACVFGIFVMFGKAEPERLNKVAVVLIFGPILLSVGGSHAASVWGSLPLYLRVLSVLALPLFLSAISKVMFPNVKILHDLEKAAFFAVVSAITFPLRLVYRGVRDLTARDGDRIDLDEYRPVVGGSVPVNRERRGGPNA